MTDTVVLLYAAHCATGCCCSMLSGGLHDRYCCFPLIVLLVVVVQCYLEDYMTYTVIPMLCGYRLSVHDWLVGFSVEVNQERLHDLVTEKAFPVSGWLVGVVCLFATLTSVDWLYGVM